MKSNSKLLSSSMVVISNVLFIFAIICVVALPFLLKLYFEVFRINFIDELYIKMLIVVYISGILSILILWNGRKILTNIKNNNPFTTDTVIRIKRIGFLCSLISLTYFITVFFLTSPTTVLILIAFAFISALVFLCADVFEKAKEYKEENELTI